MIDLFSSQVRIDNERMQVTHGSPFCNSQHWIGYIFHRLFLMNSQKVAPSVTPAKAGVQNFLELLDSGACPGPDPGFAGMTDRFEIRLFTRPSFWMLFLFISI
jgi:hypothetical protein